MRKKLTLLLWFWDRVGQLLSVPLLAWVLPVFSKLLRKRKAFESKNQHDPFATSFRATQQQADLALEFSSEGELEQVLPIITFFLQQQKKIELIYCSPSVESHVHKLCQQYPHHLRSFRLPLLTTYWGNPKLSQWCTADIIFLCRYDFFPQLLALKLRARGFFLVSATLKGKNLNGLSGFFWKNLYQLFDRLVAATPQDKDLLHQKLSICPQQLEVFDFRLIRIQERLDRKLETLGEYSWFSDFISYLNHFPQSQRLIFGNFWSHEWRLLQSPELQAKVLKGQQQITLIPHQVNTQSIAELKQTLTQFLPEYPVFFLEDSSQCLPQDLLEKPRLIVLALKGVLCELYSYFGRAYVGGGFCVSVHSLLEPYLAGCQLASGPKVSRSTEYDTICAQGGQVCLLEKNGQSLLDWLSQPDERGQVQYADAIRKKLLTDFQQWVDGKNGKCTT